MNLYKFTSERGTYVEYYNVIAKDWAEAYAKLQAYSRKVLQEINITSSELYIKNVIV